MAKDSLRQDGWGGGNALQRDFEIFMGIALQRDFGFFGISDVICPGFTAEIVVRDESRCKASAYLNKKENSAAQIARWALYYLVLCGGIFDFKLLSRYIPCHDSR